MEDKLESPHPDYLRGFNEGYTIKTHMPDLADKIIGGLSDSDRSIGFKDGCNQVDFEKNKAKEQYPRWLKEDRFKHLDSSKDKKRDKDDVDRE